MTFTVSRRCPGSTGGLRGFCGLLLSPHPTRAPEVTISHCGQCPSFWGLRTETPAHPGPSRQPQPHAPSVSVWRTGIRAETRCGSRSTMGSAVSPLAWWLLPED